MSAAGRPSDWNEPSMETPSTGLRTPRVRPLTDRSSSATAKALASSAKPELAQCATADALRKSLLLEVERASAQQCNGLRESVQLNRASGATAARSPSTVISIDQLGSARGSEKRTPSRNSREACRFHLPQGTNTPGTPRTSAFSHRGLAPDLTEQTAVHKPDHSALEECRFHTKPTPRARSAGADRRSAFGLELGGAAGCLSHNRRHDTPGGRIDRLGKVRSTTPDYHVRYAGNVLGSSLSCSSAVLTEGLKSPRQPLQASPRSRGTADTPAAIRASQRNAPWEQSPGSQWKTKCPLKPQAMHLSSGVALA
jgi:hypothetical protein